MKKTRKHSEIVKGKLDIIERLPSSCFGNPRYLAKIGGHVFRTQVDSMLAYGITNHEGQKVIAEIGPYYGKQTVFVLKAA
jgi:hypothetical protein